MICLIFVFIAIVMFVVDFFYYRSFVDSHKKIVDKLQKNIVLLKKQIEELEKEEATNAK